MIAHNQPRYILACHQRTVNAPEISFFVKNTCTIRFWNEYHVYYIMSTLQVMEHPSTIHTA
jgi:hypothetical protein